MKKYYLVISTNMGNSRIFESKEFDSIDEAKKSWDDFSRNFNYIVFDLIVEIFSIIKYEDDCSEEKHELSLFYNGISKW